MRRDKPVAEYKERDRILRGIGFKDYRDYLASSTWAKIRTAKLKRVPACEICHDMAIQVHHRTYSALNLLGHSNEGLLSVCRSCHWMLEFRPGGIKRTMAEAVKAVGRLMSQHRRSIRGFAASVLYSEPKGVDAEFKARLEREN